MCALYVCVCPIYFVRWVLGFHWIQRSLGAALMKGIRDEGQSSHGVRSDLDLLPFLLTFGCGSLGGGGIAIDWVTQRWRFWQDQTRVRAGLHVLFCLMDARVSLGHFLGACELTVLHLACQYVLALQNVTVWLLQPTLCAGSAL